MAGTSPSTGNPLQGTNYLSNEKWGQINGTPNKWGNLTTRPDPVEKSLYYEGEG